MIKKVVILGGGFAGAYIAKHLEGKFETTLIDTKDYFEYTPSVLRTLVEPKHVKKIQALHTHYLHKAHVVRDHIKEIDEKKVVGAHIYPYDYLVICTGSRYNSPIKESDIVITSRAAELRSYSQKLIKAKEVLIIGGGLVGVELAAEIAQTFPQKEITLIQSKERLIERNHPKASLYVQKFLEKRKVKIIFNERIEKSKDNKYITKSGKEFSAGIAFLCTGIIPNYEHLEKFFSKSLDAKKQLCVNKHLQVKNHPTIFAAGDITDVFEEKVAQVAEKHAKMVVENIERLENNQPLAEYLPKPRPMVISLGKWDGIFVYKNFMITGLIPGILKSILEWEKMRRYR